MLGMKMQTSLLLLLLVTAALTADSTNRDAAAQDVRPRLSCCPGGAPRVPGDIVECKWQGKGRCATEAYVVKTTQTNTWQCISKDSVWLKKELLKIQKKMQSIKCNALTVDSTNRDAAAQDVVRRPPCCPGGNPRVPGDIVECKWQGKGRCATEAYVVKTTHTNTWQCISKDSVWLKKQLKTRSIKCN